MKDYVLDTGALIALERGVQRMQNVFDDALHDRIQVVLPCTVIAQA